MNSNEHFFEKVYEIVRQIPPGRVSTYGAIAACVGAPRASRMVGWALNASHTEASFIPAHRVVNRNGILSGKNHFRTRYLMEELLHNEGVEVHNDKVVHFNQLFWDPVVELSRP